MWNFVREQIKDGNCPNCNNQLIKNNEKIFKEKLLSNIDYNCSVLCDNCISMWRLVMFSLNRNMINW